MSFLKNFWRQPTNGLVIARASLRHRVETISIGINESRNIAKKEPIRAKLKNFRPDEEDGRLELSTFCIDELDEPARWALLDQHSNKPPIPGRADLTSVAVTEVGLRLDADWEPERHANVLGWPLDEHEEMNLAQALFDRQIFRSRSK